MQCPRCREGGILVIKNLVCSCGHPMLICDKCFSIFAVECGPPIGPYKLPPEYEITFSERKTESFGKIFREYDFAGNIKQFCVPLEDFDPNEDKKVVTKETPRPPFYLRVLSRLGINI